MTNKLKDMTNKLKDVLDRAQTWPAEDQAELAEFAELIESRRRDGYSATPEELQRSMMRIAAG